MRRVFRFVIALAFMLFFFQFCVTFFINGHEIQYTIKHEETLYTVKEQFQKNGNDHYYNFEVYDKDKNKYVFYFDEDYNKKKKILTDIESYQQGDLTCLLPVFSGKKTGGVICRQNNQLISFDYLKQTGNSLSEWQMVLNQKGYQIESSDTIVNSSPLTTYQAFPEKYMITLWNYDGIFIIDKEEIKKLDVLEEDHYENTLGMLVGKKYVIAATDLPFDYNRFYIIDLNQKGKDFVDLETEISKDSYFLGAKGNKIYLMDRDKKKEYTFDVNKETLEEVGNEEKNAQVYIRGKWETKNIYTVSDNREKFDMNVEVEDLTNLYHPKMVFKSANKYYFVTENNQVYYVLQDDINTKVLLFQDNNLTEMKVVDDYLFFVSGENIMMYQSKTGYHKIITRAELQYNNKNIFDVAKK